jgi:hypothetical protein
LDYELTELATVTETAIVAEALVALAIFAFCTTSKRNRAIRGSRFVVLMFAPFLRVSVSIVLMYLSQIGVGGCDFREGDAIANVLVERR